MDERPLPQYGVLLGAYLALFGGFAVLARNRLPERIGFADLARIGLATYKLSRVVARDRVTAVVRAPVTVDEEAQQPKPDGMARAIGELVTCPYCIGVWIAAGLTSALVLFPRQTRLATTVFGAQAIADFVNVGFVRAKERAAA